MCTANTGACPQDKLAAKLLDNILLDAVRRRVAFRHMGMPEDRLRVLFLHATC